MMGAVSGVADPFMCAGGVAQGSGGGEGGDMCIYAVQCCLYACPCKCSARGIVALSLTLAPWLPASLGIKNV